VVSDFINDGEILVTPETVDDVLDVLAQLHYRGGYDRKVYRADRSSSVRRLGRNTPT
jgi:DNA-binding LacI/PurR family transcriptional regulator